MNTLTFTKVLAGAGSLILLAVAIRHLMGMDVVRDVAANVDNDLVQHGLITLWAMIAFHLIFIAVLAFGASFYRSKACAAFLMAFGVWVVLDGAVVWTHVGLVESVPMLLGSGILYLIAGTVLRRAARVA